MDKIKTVNKQENKMDNIKKYTKNRILDIKTMEKGMQINKANKKRQHYNFKYRGEFFQMDLKELKQFQTDLKKAAFDCNFLNVVFEKMEFNLKETLDYNVNENSELDRFTDENFNSGAPINNFYCTYDINKFLGINWIDIIEILDDHEMKIDRFKNDTITAVYFCIMVKFDIFLMNNLHKYVI